MGFIMKQLQSTSLEEGAAILKAIYRGRLSSINPVGAPRHAVVGGPQAHWFAPPPTSNNREQNAIKKSTVALTGSSRRSHWRGPAAASAKITEQISELGGSGGMPRRKIFQKLNPNMAFSGVLK